MSAEVGPPCSYRRTWSMSHRFAGRPHPGALQVSSRTINQRFRAWGIRRASASTAVRSPVTGSVKTRVQGVRVGRQALRRLDVDRAVPGEVRALVVETEQGERGDGQDHGARDRFASRFARAGAGVVAEALQQDVGRDVETQGAEAALLARQAVQRDRLLVDAVLDGREHVRRTDQGPRGLPIGQRLDGGVPRSRRLPAGCALRSGCRDRAVPGADGVAASGPGPTASTAAAPRPRRSAAASRPRGRPRAGAWSSSRRQPHSPARKTAHERGSDPRAADAVSSRCAAPRCDIRSTVPAATRKPFAT